MNSYSKIVTALLISTSLYAAAQSQTHLDLDWCNPLGTAGSLIVSRFETTSDLADWIADSRLCPSCTCPTARLIGELGGNVACDLLKCLAVCKLRSDARRGIADVSVLNRIESRMQLQVGRVIRSENDKQTRYLAAILGLFGLRGVADRYDYGDLESELKYCPCMFASLVVCSAVHQNCYAGRYAMVQEAHATALYHPQRQQMGGRLA